MVVEKGGQIGGSIANGNAMLVQCKASAVFSLTAEERTTSNAIPTNTQHSSNTLTSDSKSSDRKLVRRILRRLNRELPFCSDLALGVRLQSGPLGLVKPHLAAPRCV